MKSLPKSGVPWATRGWPILRGCSAASEGCRNCYAANWHHRFAKHMGIAGWGEAHFLSENLDMPFRTKKPAVIFVAPMSDLGHKSVDPAWRRDITEAMRLAPWHRYIVLTKRPGDWMGDLPAGVVAGVTAENQNRFDERWPILIRAMMNVRPRTLLVSVEPMLGPVGIISSPAIDHPCQMPDWVIAGPETGAKKRRFEHRWLDKLADESLCFYDKRNGIGLRREYPWKDAACALLEGNK